MRQRPICVLVLSMTWFIIGLVYILAAMGFLVEGIVGDSPLEGISESLLYLVLALFMLFLSSMIMAGIDGHGSYR